MPSSTILFSIFLLAIFAVLGGYHFRHIPTKVIAVTLAVVATLVALVALAMYLAPPRGRLIRSFDSPDGRWRRRRLAGR